MGSGSSALIWYFACIFVVAFMTICATSLIVWGRRSDRKKREARARALEQGDDSKPSS